MRIADIVNDSIVDGAGMRYTVFVQGCTHACKGCHNPQTHDIYGGREVSVNDLIEQVLSNPIIDGVTISGGEPFLQAAECAKLAKACKQKGLNVWTYTGYTYDQILREYNPDWNALLTNTDVLVDGLFVEKLKSYELHFRGSSNQRLIDVRKSKLAGKPVLWRENTDALDKFTTPKS